VTADVARLTALLFVLLIVGWHLSAREVYLGRPRGWRQRIGRMIAQARMWPDAGLKFFRRGKTKIMFLPAVADLAAPTRAEITAGTDLSPQIADVNGFDITNTPIETPNLAEAYTTTIDGEDKSGASSFVMYDDDTSTAVRSTIAKGTAGFILILPYGDVPTKRCEVWPVKVTGQNDIITTGNEAARYNSSYAVTRTPEQDAVVPAAA
jgi:hypothetical protein